MFKILNEPRSVLSQREAAIIYPNKSYLFLNPVDTYRVGKDGTHINTGFKGELHAISDDTIEDMEQFNTEIAKVAKQGIRYGLMDTFQYESV